MLFIFILITFFECLLAIRLRLLSERKNEPLYLRIGLFVILGNCISLLYIFNKISDYNDLMNDLNDAFSWLIIGGIIFIVDTVIFVKTIISKTNIIKSNYNKILQFIISIAVLIVTIFANVLLFFKIIDYNEKRIYKNSNKAVLKYLNNAFGDHDYEVKFVNNTYCNNGISSKEVCGYEATVTSPEVYEEFEIGLDMGTYKIDEGKFSFVEDYYNKKLVDYFGSKYGLDLKFDDLSYNDIGLYKKGKIPTIDELIDEGYLNPDLEIENTDMKDQTEIEKEKINEYNSLNDDEKLDYINNVVNDIINVLKIKNDFKLNININYDTYYIDRIENIIVIKTYVRDKVNHENIEIKKEYTINN